MNSRISSISRSRINAAHLQNTAMRFLDATMALIPRSTPSSNQLRNCQIVAHRGAHQTEQRGAHRAAHRGGDRERESKSGSTIPLENTLAAFNRAVSAGAWGVEFDIRWTSDDVPVVMHDESAVRVFGSSLSIDECDFSTLRERLPQVPTLGEALSELGGQAHAMIELKAVPNGLTRNRLARLSRETAHLKAGHDFHFISLDLELIELGLKSEIAPPNGFIAVAETNIYQASHFALTQNLGGLAGHYLLLTEAMIREHHRCHQRVGTGFIESRSVLWREIHRKVDWIFTDSAPERVMDLRTALDRPQTAHKVQSNADE